MAAKISVKMGQWISCVTNLHWSRGCNNHSGFSFLVVSEDGIPMAHYPSLIPGSPT
jgi:hypothetical protein